MKWPGRYYRKRLLMIRQPNKERQYYDNFIERLRNKNSVAFFCKFILSKKGRKIPTG